MTAAKPASGTPISVEEQRRLLLDVMDAIDKFCRERDIKYSIGYGTTLGAVRHGGFIPWDDDIDIVMLRDDYTRFVNEFSDPTGRYRVVTYDKYPAFGLTFAKVEDTRTFVNETSATMPMGLAVDIFPLDDLYDDLAESEAVVRRLNRYVMLHRSKLIKPTPMNSLAKRMALHVTNLLLAPVSLNRLARMVVGKCLSTPRKQGAANVACIVSGPGVKKIIPRRLLDRCEPVKFEDRTYMMLTATDEYLTHCYGPDYMTPPEGADRRSPHFITAVTWK